MGKYYNITVNGKTYEVEVEEVGTGAVNESVAKPIERKESVQTNAPKKEAAKVETKEEKKAVASVGSSRIDAPMPGLVLDINVKEGDSVKAGDVVLILEAMKMENEIVSPSDGIVASIQVSKGNSVGAGDLLISLN